MVEVWISRTSTDVTPSLRKAWLYSGNEQKKKINKKDIYGLIQFKLMTSRKRIDCLSQLRVRR